MAKSRRTPELCEQIRQVSEWGKGQIRARIKYLSEAKIGRCQNGPMAKSGRAPEQGLVDLVAADAATAVVVPHVECAARLVHVKVALCASR